MIKPYFKSKDNNFYLLYGDTFDLLPKINHKFDMVFADPPYFLSNNGLSVQNGKIVSVNKGKWDKSKGFEYVNNFNRNWLKAVRKLMKDDATIWISGTAHNIFSIGQILTELDYKILNIITWQKTNPPPNFSRRYFTHSTEQIIWARKHKNIPHYFNYELMKEINDGKQMKDVWTLPAIAKWEKSCKKHPTQKPLSVLTRIILASTKPGAIILDPFTGSSTTGIAANLSKRKFLGIDKEKEFLEISKCRKIEIENPEIASTYRKKMQGFNNNKEYNNYIKTLTKKDDDKIILGFCRKKNIPNLIKTNKFYFHHLENDASFNSLLNQIDEAKYIYTFQYKNNDSILLTGHFARIKNIKKLHKSKIAGKENSKTEFYWEITLKTLFTFDKKIKRDINIDLIFNNDDNNKLLIKKFIPVIIDKNKLINSIF